MFHFLRALFRFISFLLVSTYILVKVYWNFYFKGIHLSKAKSYLQRAAQILIHIFGVQLDQVTTPAFMGPCIFVSNHRSYFDPVVTIRNIQAYPISKEEVRHWPFIGHAAYMAGVIFVKREEKSSRKLALESLLSYLNQGHSVLVYPEGTTTKSPGMAPFRPGVFRLAAENDIPIIPIAIDYNDPNDAFIDDDTFIPHFFRVFGRARIKIKIHFGPAIYGNDQSILAENTKDWIESELAAMQEQR